MRANCSPIALLLGASHSRTGSLLKVFVVLLPLFLVLLLFLGEILTRDRAHVYRDFSIIGNCPPFDAFWVDRLYIL